MNIKHLIKLLILLLIVFSAPTPGQAAETDNKDSRDGTLVSRDKITHVKIMIDAVEGGSKINTLPLNYPPATVIVTNVSLTVKKGSYKIELMENEKPVITLASQEGKTVSASGRLNMSEDGTLQYKVTAKKAKGILCDLSFSPYQEKLRASVASADGKLSVNGDEFKLKLTCVEGKDCLLRIQNASSSKACRNIFFQIDYNVMNQNGSFRKNKAGTIEDVLMPGKTGEWMVGLIFGEPPKDIKISVVQLEAIDASELASSPGASSSKGTVEMLPIAPLSGESAISAGQIK